MKNLQEREAERTEQHHHHHHACDLSDPAQLVALRDRMAELGWTFKVRFVDRNLEKPLIGIRLTNAAALFESARSIQIFDKSTVTLQTGFTNDGAISLTKEDGRDFLLWMHAAKPDLVAPIWHALPDEGSAAQLAMEAPFVDLDKNHLVMYLAHAYPELFGPNGIVAMTGASFHGEILRLIKDPVRDDLKRFAQVQTIENMAHAFYSEAAGYLRASADSGMGFEYVARMKRLAHALVLAAERARDEANVIRQRMDTPPPVQPFPEAITVDDQGEVKTAEVAGTPITSEDITLGDVVGVMDPQSAYFRQMGRVVALEPPNKATLEISGQSHPIRFSFDQLMRLA
jgi:hypothetical protein